MDIGVRESLADQVVAVLRAHEPDFRKAGLKRLSVFGSVARGDHENDSDIDLAAELEREMRPDLVDLIRIEQRLGTLLGRPVHLITEPIAKPRLRANLKRDRLRAF